MSQIEFKRNNDKVMARATDTGIWVIETWTMGIPKQKAIEYVNKYNSTPEEGFYEDEGSVILSHDEGKIAFSPQEANAVVDLIRAAYL